MSSVVGQVLNRSVNRQGVIMVCTALTPCCCRIVLSPSNIVEENYTMSHKILNPNSSKSTPTTAIKLGGFRNTPKRFIP